MRKQTNTTQYMKMVIDGNIVLLI